MPSRVTWSPAETGWSRPGQQAISPPSTGMTATGTRLPNRPRNVEWQPSCFVDDDLDHGEALTAQFYVVGGCRRHASTNEGAASAATSRTLPGSANSLECLADRRVGQLDDEAQRRAGPLAPAVAISRVTSSFVSTQITAAARSSPASVSPSPSRR